MKRLLLILIVVLVIGGGVYEFYQWRIAQARNGGSQAVNDDSGIQKSPYYIDAENSGAILIVSHNKNFGDYLSTAAGVSLYRYVKDKPGASSCSGECALLWLPFTVSSDAVLKGGSGISGKIGTIIRGDGKLQVTYNDLPLYFWSEDSNAGDISGQGYQNVWFLVKP
jgi:predicted lipoprotein with Yx(FWY)xxD motif